MLHAHTQHVQEDAHHDEYVELLIRGQIEEEPSDGELERNEGVVPLAPLDFLTRGRGKALVGFLLPIFRMAL